MIDALQAAIDTLLREDLTAFTDAEFAARVRGLEVCRRRLETVGHRHVVEVNDRKLWTTTGAAGLYRYLVETLRLAKADAVARVKTAAQLGVLTSAYGEKCEPRLPATAAAQAEGAISGARLWAATFGEQLGVHDPEAFDPSADLAWVGTHTRAGGVMTEAVSLMVVERVDVLPARPGWLFVTGILSGRAVGAGDSVLVHHGGETRPAIVRAVEIHTADGGTTICLDAELGPIVGVGTLISR